MASGQTAARDDIERGLLYGSPATVAEKLANLEKAGLGGLIIHFRLGPMSWDDAESSLRLFAEKVAPELRTVAAG